MNPLLEVDDLRKSYPGRPPALAGLDFRAAAGERIALLGVNGAGKTTAFRLILGLLQPDRGSVRLDGAVVARDPCRVQARTGYLPEHAPLYPELSPAQHLRLLAGLRGLAKPGDRLDALRRDCGLEEVWSRPAAVLSKGFRQRLALAAALLHEPDLLVLDEPTSGLDPRQIDQFRGLLRAVPAGRTVLLSTHILAEAEAVCSRCLVLHEGRLVADTPLPVPAGKAWRVEWRGPAWPTSWPGAALRDLEDGWRRADLDLEDPDRGPALLADLAAAGCRVRHFSRPGRSLEDLFLAATAGRRDD